MADTWSMRLLYISLLRSEDAPLYHTCPACLAARLLAPPAWSCRSCRWAHLAAAEAVARTATETTLRILKTSKPEVVILDGVEPLEQPGSLQLPQALHEATATRPALAAATTGNTRPETIEEALTAAGYTTIIYDYTLHLEKPPRGIDNAIKALEAASRHAKTLEIILHWHPAKRGQEQVLASLAHRHPHAALHVTAPDEHAQQQAAKAVEKLRDRGHNVYLHPDEPGLYSDTHCPSCGAELVTRKPWGTRLHLQPRGPHTPAKCPRCGTRLHLLACPPRRPLAAHREHTMW